MGGRHIATVKASSSLSHERSKTSSPAARSTACGRASEGNVALTPMPSVIVSGPLHITRQSSASKTLCSVASEMPAMKDMTKAPSFSRSPAKESRSCGRAASRMKSARETSVRVSVMHEASPMRSARASVAALPPHDMSSRSLGKPFAASAAAIEEPRCPKPAIPIVFPSRSPSVYSAQSAKFVISKIPF